MSMSRLAVLRRNPKRTFSALILALMGIGIAVGSGASFSSTSAPSAGVYTAGTLHHHAAAGGAIASATINNIKPGWGTTDGTAVDTATSSPGYGTLTLSNDGSLAGVFTVVSNETSAAYSGTTPPAAEVCGGGEGSSGTCSALDGALKVKIDKVVSGTTTNVYDGLVSGLASNHSIETAYTLAAGGSRVYKFYFYFPDSGNQNAYQGSSATVTLGVSEAQ